MSPSAYAAWSKDDLIARIQSLEAVLASDPKIPPEKIPRPQIPTASQAPQKKSKKERKPFDINAYPKRKIALKFCYAGWEYNGLAFQTDPTPLPMVEAVLLKAMGDCRLIDPELGLEGCGWSRCGRTDKGVSGAGQVVSLWVRSAIGTRPDARKKNLPVEDIAAASQTETPEAITDGHTEQVAANANPADAEQSELPDQPQAELRYVAMLNAVLPRSIRVLAWSPVADEFDARFSCTFRHYKYFFSAGFPPYPHLSLSSGESGFLDIEAMQDGAARLVGNHDFRNFCKIDPSKQVDNYTRRITHATITPVNTSNDSVPSGSPSIPSLYVLDLKGAGFLYHQVRHIMAILFLIGARLEPPSIVDTLLDAQTITRKPVYEMADGLPLVLWDCGYPDGSVSWRVDDSKSANPASASRAGGPQSAHNLFYDFDLLASQSQTKAVMMEHFAQAAEVFHSPPRPPSDDAGVFRVPLGGGLFLQSALNKYVKLLDRPRGERSEDLNERWRTGAGARRKERRDARAVAATGGSAAETDGDPILQAENYPPRSHNNL
ncbi:hypothetical protein M407DRAFT_79378 [Tulasnella calospora MUT 4182]|uniref:Pseudouridine synthase I TruA alpha/beta domain-containing protein n=1 Tax=Tulasnella calospora MUT 4182 TaxID=1051891 RepID=A0A0C3QB79_9AGAM|nr:hypothetical protein M407DRAFT_79378 [Tulasnella calospora MUT 4182]